MGTREGFSWNNDHDMMKNIIIHTSYRDWIKTDIKTFTIKAIAISRDFEVTTKILDDSVGGFKHE